jgi:hypothetical protein
MPFDDDTKRFSRVWAFADQFDAGEEAMRANFDVALADLATGLNDSIAYLEDLVDDAGPRSNPSAQQHFSSRSIAQTTFIGANIRRITVEHSGRVYAFDADATGTALATAGGRKWSPAGLGDPRHWGATGGSDDTTAMQAWATWDAPKLMPQGVTFTSRELTISGDVLWEAGSKLLMRVDCGGTAFVALASGCRVHGAVWIDGNAVARKASGNGNKTAFRCVGQSNVQVTGHIRIENVWGRPAQISTNTDSRFPDVKAKTCAMALSFSSNTRCSIGDIWLETFANDTLAQPPRALQVLENTGSRVGNITMTGLTATAYSGDPTRQQAVVVARNEDCSIGAIRVSGINNTAKSSHGLSAVSNKRCFFGPLEIRSATIGVEDVGNLACFWPSAVIDHEDNWTAAASAGQSSMIGWDCKNPQDITDEATERNKVGAARNYVGSLIVRRGSTAMSVTTDATYFARVLGEGNYVCGLEVDRSDIVAVTSAIRNWPGNTEPYDRIADAQIGHAEFRGNGICGVDFKSLDKISIAELVCHDNGWRTGETAARRAGITSRTQPTGAALEIRIGHLDTKSPSTWSKTAAAGCSFGSGVSDANGDLVVSMIIPMPVFVGACVNLVDADDGSDVVARVVDMTGDRLTLRLPTPAMELISAASLTALTGTWNIAADGASATVASGSPAETLIVGATFVTDGTNWALVSRVNETAGVITSIEFATGFTFPAVAVTGATLTKREIAWNGVRYQLFGANFDAGEVGGLVIGEFTGEAEPPAGGANMVVDPADFGPGSVAWFDKTTAIDATDAETNTNLMAIPAGFRVEGHRGQVVTEITGTSAPTTVMRIRMWNGGLGAGNGQILVSGLALAAGTKWVSGVPCGAAGADQLRAQFTGGADNTTTGGSVRIEAFTRRVCLPEFA